MEDEATVLLSVIFSQLSCGRMGIIVMEDDSLSVSNNWNLSNPFQLVWDSCMDYIAFLSEITSRTGEICCDNSFELFRIKFFWTTLFQLILYTEIPTLKKEKTPLTTLFIQCIFPISALNRFCCCTWIDTFLKFIK